MRAAANSMARGSPSKRAQISATAGALAFVTWKFWLDRLRPLNEDRDGLVLRHRRQVGQVFGIRQRQCWHGELLLGSHMQCLPTRDQHVEPGTGAQQIGYLRGCARYLLKVVQQ